jgi:hypothetical protein
MTSFSIKLLNLVLQFRMIQTHSSIENRVSNAKNGQDCQRKRKRNLQTKHESKIGGKYEFSQRIDVGNGTNWDENPSCQNKNWKQNWKRAQRIKLDSLPVERKPQSLSMTVLALIDWHNNETLQQTVQQFLNRRSPGVTKCHLVPIRKGKGNEKYFFNANVSKNNAKHQSKLRTFVNNSLVELVIFL